CPSKSPVTFVVCCANPRNQPRAAATVQVMARRALMVMGDASTVTLPDILVDVLREHRKSALELRMQLGAGRLPDDALLFSAQWRPAIANRRVNGVGRVCRTASACQRGHSTGTAWRRTFNPPFAISTSRRTAGNGLPISTPMFFAPNATF